MSGLAGSGPRAMAARSWQRPWAAAGAARWLQATTEGILDDGARAGRELSDRPRRDAGKERS